MDMTGRWELTSSQNYGQYVEALGGNGTAKRVAEVGSPVLEITLDGEGWALRTSGGIRRTEVVFRTGDTVEVETPAGKGTAVFTVTDTGGLLERGAVRGLEYTVLREPSASSLAERAEAGGVVATRVWSRG